MEYRKLISFGKSSYVVSLPKSWVVRQNLKKGDIIYFDENENNLILGTKNEQKENALKEVTIEVDGKEIKQVKREIFGAYINNYRLITLIGNEIREKAPEIESIVQKLIALEIMEQTSKKIVAKDFLNFDDISVDNIIRKIDIVVRAMMEDCENMFQEEVYESINYRDNDVNKLVFLIFRIVKFGYENLSYVSKKFQLDANKLSNYWLLASHLESVADEIKRVARKMKEIDLPKKEKQVYRQLLGEIHENYLKIMKSYYNWDVNAVHKVINYRDNLVAQADKFYHDNENVKGISFLTDKTKSLIVHICHVGRILYQN